MKIWVHLAVGFVSERDKRTKSWSWHHTKSWIASQWRGEISNASTPLESNSNSQYFHFNFALHLHWRAGFSIVSQLWIQNEGALRKFISIFFKSFKLPNIQLETATAVDRWVSHCLIHHSVFTSIGRSDGDGDGGDDSDNDDDGFDNGACVEVC